MSASSQHKDKVSLETQVYLEEIARLTSNGLNPQQIAIKADLDEATVRRLMALPEFEAIFSHFDPSAYKTWRETRDSESLRQAVISQAREDAPEHYRMLRELVRTSTQLRDAERAVIIEKLIKFSGDIGEGAEHETVSLSQAQLANIHETLNETARASDTGNQDSA